VVLKVPDGGFQFLKQFSSLDGFGNVYHASQCLIMGEVGC
jgi:hypothetical protein